MGAAHRIRDDEKGRKQSAAGEEMKKGVAGTGRPPAAISQCGSPEETEEEARGGVPGDGSTKQQPRASGEAGQGQRQARSGAPGPGLSLYPLGNREALAAGKGSQGRGTAEPIDGRQGEEHQQRGVAHHSGVKRVAP